MKRTSSRPKVSADPCPLELARDRRRRCLDLRPVAAVAHRQALRERRHERDESFGEPDRLAIPLSAPKKTR